MDNTKHKPTANGPQENYRKTYILEVINKFLDKYVFVGGDEEVSDGVWYYGVNLLKCFMLLVDFKDAVSTGNGEHLLILRKQLLAHFFSTPRLNEFAIEMFINILQCEVLLSKAEAHCCKWAATVNWKGGSGKNIEIDLFQENRNCEMKKLIRSMGANKTGGIRSQGRARLQEELRRLSKHMSSIVQHSQHSSQIFNSFTQNCGN
jgi:hypothetical protein